MDNKSYVKSIKQKNKASSKYMIANGIFGVITPLIVVVLLGKLSAGNMELKTALPLVGAILAAQIIKAVLYGAGIWKAHETAYQSLADIRTEIVDKLNHLPISFFQKRSTGELSGIMNSDVQQVEKYLSHAQPEILITTVVPVVSLLAMFFIHWKQAIALVLPIPALFLWQQIINKTFSARIQQYMKSTKETTRQLLEYISSMPLIKAFSTEENKTSALLKHLHDYIRWVKKVTFAISLPTCVIQMLLECSLILVVLTGFYLVAGGVLTITKCILAIILTGFFTESLTRYLGFHHMEILLNRSAESICSILGEPALPVFPPNPSAKAGDIRFEEVSFAYAGRDTVLNDVTFTIPAGAQTAIVGSSGSGKTSIANLIMGFWPVSSGKITIGGQNLSTMNEEDLNGMVSIVQQDSFFFNATITENLKIGKPDATQEEITAACKKARIHSFIMSLPDGYNTVISESSLDFSGGEKQRLSIARMILKDAPILLFDEATAAVDGYNAHLIQQALKELGQGKTKISISHHLQSVTEADQIIVMEKGRVCGLGKHTQLIKNCPAYQILVEAEKSTGEWSMEKSEDKKHD